MKNEILEAALIYAQIGWSVFPVGRDKKPLTKNGFNDATTDTNQIKKWFSNNNANVAIATGSKSKGLVVIDIDIDESAGKYGNESIEHWEEKTGCCIDSLSAITGRGGKHLYFYSTEKFGCKVGALPNVDIRGEGGYVVAPPSIHQNGNEYYWDNLNDDIEKEIVNVQQDSDVEYFLHECFKNKVEQKQKFSAPKVVEEGTRNDTLFKMASSLQARGVEDEIIWQTCIGYNNTFPQPIEQKELEATIKSALKYKKGNSIQQNLSEDENISLAVNSKGNIVQSIDNAMLVLNHDESISGCFKLNTFDRNIWIKCEPGKALPWRNTESNYRKFDSGDEAYLYRLMQRYGIMKSCEIDRALQITAIENSFNPILEILNSIKWDGKKRIYSLLHDFLGADLNEYSSKMMEIVLLGAINRALKPGSKFDLVMILTGEQGIGKSTFIRRLALDDSFYCDSLKTLADKSAAEQLRGKWIIEIAELLAVKRTKEVEAVKSFITQNTDNYRPAYGKLAEDFPRTCIFIGSTNAVNFLSDPTGNRRFLPMETGKSKPSRSLFAPETADYFQQVWAEAYEIYKTGDYSLTIPEELLKVVEQMREQHTEEDPEKAIIERWLYKHKKTEVCTNQLFWEALENNKDHCVYGKREAWRMNEIMQSMPGWKRADKTKSFGEYGQVRYYYKVAQNYDNPSANYDNLSEKVRQPLEESTDFQPLKSDEDMPFK